MTPFSHSTLPDNYSTFFHTLYPGHGHPVAVTGPGIAAEIQRLATGVFSQDVLTEARRPLVLGTRLTGRTLPISQEINPLLRSAITAAHLPLPPAATVSPAALERFVNSLTHLQKEAIAREMNSILERTSTWASSGYDTKTGFQAFPNNVIFQVLLAYVKPSKTNIELHSLSYAQFVERITSSLDKTEQTLSAQEVIEYLLSFPENTSQRDLIEASKTALTNHLETLQTSSDARIPAVNFFGKHYLDGDYGQPRYDLLAMAAMMTSPAIGTSLPDSLSDLQVFLQNHPDTNAIQGSIYNLFNLIQDNNPQLLFHIVADCQRRDQLAERNDEMFRYLPRPLELPAVVRPVAHITAALAHAAPFYPRAAGGAGAAAYFPTPLPSVRAVAATPYEEISRIMRMTDWKRAATSMAAVKDPYLFDIKQTGRDYRLIRVMHDIEQCIYYGIGQGDLDAGKARWASFVDAMSKIPEAILFTDLPSKPRFASCAAGADSLVFLHGSSIARNFRDDHRNPDLMSLVRKEVTYDYRFGDGVYLTPTESIARRYAALRGSTGLNGYLKFLFRPMCPQMRVNARGEREFVKDPDGHVISVPDATAQIAYVENPALLENYIKAMQSIYTSAFAACRSEINGDCLSVDGIKDIEAHHLTNSAIIAATRQHHQKVVGLAISNFEGDGAAFVSYAGTKQELPSDGVLELVAFAPYFSYGGPPGPEEPLTRAGRK